MCAVPLLLALGVAYPSHGSPISNPVPTPYLKPSIPKQQSPPLLLNKAGFLMNNQPHGNIEYSPVQAGSCPVPIPIVDKSLSCMQHRLPRIRLSNDDLKHVLSAEGGNYAQMYMATSAREAQKNFKNLIPLNADNQNSLLGTHPDNWSWNFARTKKELLEHLERAYQENIVSPPVHASVKPTPNLLQELFNRTLYRLAEQVNIAVSKTTMFRRPALRTSGRRRRIKNNIPMRILAQLLPARYIYPEGKKQRDVNGAVSDAEYCQASGTGTADGYLRLCSTCAHTTTLDSNHFPRIINEVWCNSNVKGCLYVNGNAHGACRQSVFYMTMLRKKPNTCMTVIKNGVHYLTDEWERYDQPIKVGCDCLIDKRSVFAKYVNP